MAKVDELELKLMEENTFDKYDSDVKRNSKFDTIPYMMALSETFREVCSNDDMMMIGGSGVLVNLVKHKGEEIIPLWRGTHDIDLAIWDKNCIEMVPEIFDILDIPLTHSHSISGKYTTRGKSHDFEGRDLRSIPIDVYGPKGDPREGITLNGHVLKENSWENKSGANFFGVWVNSLGVLDLLYLKTDISCKKSPLLLRRQDQQDIYHLLACAEEENYSPSQISGRLGEKNYKRLVSNLDNYLENLEVKEDSEIIFKISDQYLNLLREQE